MNSRLFLLAFATVLFIGARLTAEEPTKKQATEEEIKARLAEHARKHAMKSAEVPQKETAATAATGNTPAKPNTGTGAPVNPHAAAQPANATAATNPPAPEPASLLPKVDVKRDRITELDRQLEKQNAEIAREKVNTKPTALDDTLNGAKVSKTLAIFGGQSSDDRASIAKERVAMMEEERDLIEAIAQAQSKEEKEELQKTLDSMRAMRRELEASLR